MPSIFPEVPEAGGRKLGVANGVLDILVAEVVLQSAGIVAVVGELVTAGVAQHVWMDREWHLGGLAEALDEMMEHRPATLRNEHMSFCRIIAA